MNISTTKPTREINYDPFERSDIEFSFISTNPCRRAPILQNINFFFRYRRFARGACSKKRIFLRFVAQGLVVEWHGIAFLLFENF